MCCMNPGLFFLKATLGTADNNLFWKVGIGHRDQMGLLLGYHHLTVAELAVELSTFMVLKDFNLLHLAQN